MFRSTYSLRTCFAFSVFFSTLDNDTNIVIIVQACRHMYFGFMTVCILGDSNTD